MQKRTRNTSAGWMTLAALAGGLAAAGSTAAQESEEPRAELEEVVVTASRREEALQDVAMAVSVLDTGKLADGGLTGLAEILPFVPGVSVVNTGRPFFNSVYMRGINAQLAAGVTSYIDDIPFGSSTVYTTPTPVDGTLLDLESLNVLKGPQGTLYGASSIGGILKFRTRDASLEEWSGSASADLSTTEGGGLNQLYRLSANGPIVSDTLGVSFTAFWQDKTGYIDNTVLGIDGWDDNEYYGGSGSLRWAVTDRLEIKLQGLYQKSTQDGLATIQANHADDQFLPGVGEGEPWYGEYETGESDINPSVFDAQLFGLTIDYDLGFGTFTSVTSTQELQFVQSIDVTVPFASFGDLFFPENAPHSSAVLVGDLGFEKFTQEFRLTSNSNESFEWIVGAYYTEEEGFNIQDLVLEPDSPLYFANFPSDFEETSLYATGTWYFTPDFDASVGVRYADYSNDVVLNVIGPLLAPIPPSAIDDDVTNWLFNVRYRAGDDLSFYGRIASGYRPGGANFLILDPTGQPLSDPFFEPDELWSYEAGMKGRTADGALGFDVSVFYIDWQDYQVTLSRGGVNVAANAESATSQGVEAMLDWQLGDALTLTGTLSWVDAELDKDDPALGGAAGTQLPNTPEWQASLDAEWRFALGDLPAYVGAAWRYKGDMPVGFPGYTGADGTVFPASTPRLEIDSYNLVDLRAGLTLGAFDLSLYVTNLFDEYGYTHFAPSFAAISTATPTRPRTYGAVLRWNFF